jgi:hypothetical protein
LELADVLGLTPIRVSRTLCRLNREKLVETQRNFIVLKDIDRLTAIAHYDLSLLASFGLNCAALVHRGSPPGEPIRFSIVVRRAGARPGRMLPRRPERPAVTPAFGQPKETES